MNLSLCVHLINIFSFLMGVELRHFFYPKCLGGFLVCVICNSNSINSFIFKLCIMIVHTLKMCTSYFVHISRIFSSFFGVLNLDSFFLFKMLRWCLVCVICNSNSFHSSIFKLCIMIVHTLDMCNSYVVHI